MPLISVILPTRNRAALLERAIASVFAQTLQDLELIVIDDASHDDTRQVLAKYQTCANVRCTSLGEAKGAYFTRNLGLKMAEGRYIAFLDDDDFWLPHKLERQIPILEADPAVSMVGCWYEFANRIWKVPETMSLRWLLSINFLSCPTLVLRKSVVDAVGGFDETLQNTGDWDLWIRVAERGPIRYVQECLVYCSTVAPNRLTKREPLAYYADYLKVIDRHQHRMGFWTRHRHHYNRLYHTAAASPFFARWTLGFLYLVFREIDSVVAPGCPTGRVIDIGAKQLSHSG